MYHFFKEKLKYRGKKYGVIVRNAPNCGLFSFFIVVMGAIDKCEKNGLIPIVDMMNWPNIYLEEGEVGYKNAWELFFCQPMNIGLEEISYSKAVVIDADRDISETDRPHIGMDFLADDDIINYWRRICRKYIHFQPEIQSILEKRKAELDEFEGKKLGVLCRGTDYLALKPGGHPRQPDINSAINKAKQIFEERGCKYIFLATEDEKILSGFRKEFKELVIVNECQRYSDTGNKYLSQVIKEKNISRYESGINYLVNIYLLSQCECLLSGRVSGLLGALLLSEEYEYSYFWDLGLYS